MLVEEARGMLGPARAQGDACAVRELEVVAVTALQPGQIGALED